MHGQPHINLIRCRYGVGLLSIALFHWVWPKIGCSCYLSNALISGLPSHYLPATIHCLHNHNGTWYDAGTTLFYLGYPYFNDFSWGLPIPPYLFNPSYLWSDLPLPASHYPMHKQPIINLIQCRYDIGLLVSSLYNWVWPRLSCIC